MCWRRGDVLRELGCEVCWRSSWRYGVVLLEKDGGCMSWCRVVWCDCFERGKSYLQVWCDCVAGG